MRRNLATDVNLVNYIIALPFPLRCRGTREVGEAMADMNTIDLISIDDTTGHVRLHLTVEGDWPNYETKMDWIRQRLNTYFFFVQSGQLATREKYRDRLIKFLVHCETRPPPLALITFGRMKRHLEGQSIALIVTVGRELSAAIALPESG
jgi:hypothetical protein